MKLQTSGIRQVSSIGNNVTIEYFAWWSSCHRPICNPTEDVRQTRVAVLPAAHRFAVGISRIIREEATWPAGAGLWPLELLHRRPWALTTRWSEIITESDPLTLGPGHGGEGVDALWRTGSGWALRLSRQGDGGALGPRWYRLECLERVFWWVPGRGCGRRERGDIFGLLTLCQGRRTLPLYHRLSWRGRCVWRRGNMTNAKQGIEGRH